MKRPWFWAIAAIAVVLGFILGRATGMSTIPGLIELHKDFPLFPAPPTPDVIPSVNAPIAENDIVVELPVDGAIVSDAFVDIAGRARTAGGALHVRLKNATGVVIAESDLDVTATDGNPYGRFGQTLSFTSAPSGDGTIEMMRVGGNDSAIVRHVKFVSSMPANGLTVKVYFNKSAVTGGSSTADECGVVYPVDRTVDDKSAAFRSTIEALLGGPTPDEKAAGYATLIPDGVKLKSVAADADGIVTADFTPALTRRVVGTCRISAIRSQIEATLRQFPEVHGVVISVNGKSDGVLQL